MITLTGAELLGRVGAAAQRPRECEAGEGAAQQDLFAVGRTIIAAFGNDLPAEVLRRISERATTEIVTSALRSDVLECVRQLLWARKSEAAARLAAVLPDPPEAWLLVHVGAGDVAAAQSAALACARADRRSSLVASLVLSSDTPGLHARAWEVLAGDLQAPTKASPALELHALAAQPTDAATWGSVLIALMQVGRLDLFATAVGIADTIAGPAPWRLLVGALASMEDPEARAAASETWVRANERFPQDVPLLAMGAVLAARTGQSGLARKRLGACTDRAPTAPGVWLTAALVATEPRTAQRALTTAEACGADPAVVDLLRMCARG